MQTETVTVAYVNDPKPGKRYGSIKTEEGHYYSVQPAQLALFKKGGTYQINYKFDDTGQYRNFVSMAGASPGNKSLPNGNGHTKAEEMFVMGVIGRAIQGSGTVPDEATLTSFVRHAKNAWRKGMAEAPARGDEPPFNDEIPY